MTTTLRASPELVRKAVMRFGVAPPVLAAVLFIPAGTWRYWEAWVYMAVLFVPLAFAGWYLLTHHADLVERRMRLREQEAEQRRIVSISLLPFLLAFLVPGLDHRFGWSDIPTAVVLGADLLVFVGYLIVLLAFRENRYAARVVQVEAAQEVISTGPYSIVRHPMYVGVLPMYLLSPIALGSWLAALFALPLLWVIVARIRSEEAVLLRDLPGYAEYRERVRYRLVPGVW